MSNMKKSILCAMLLISCLNAQAKGLNFEQQKFTADDGVLVVDQAGNVVYQWQPNKRLVPASVLKIVTAQQAIEKWGLQHRFHTDFFVQQDQLWVKAYGDPSLVSQEIEQLAANLAQQLDKQIIIKITREIKALYIDNSYFQLTEALPGRTSVSDPYNAPISATSANFNTVTIRKTGKTIRSAEKQTPLTATARALAKKLPSSIQRVNVQNRDNAQQHFAELLKAKLAVHNIKVGQIVISQALPEQAQLIYRHVNSKNLENILQGALFYSNNFVANQLFMLLAQPNPTKTQLPDRYSHNLSLAQAQRVVSRMLAQRFSWSDVNLVEGAGLSRLNRLSVTQINQVLDAFKPHRKLLKKYPLKDTMRRAQAYAKSGTLKGVRSLAGYLTLPHSSTDRAKQYQFVFMFNRDVPFAYRENLLQALAEYLAKTGSR